MYEQFRRHNRKRTILSVSEFQNRSGQQTLLCIDKGALYAVRQLVLSYGFWVSSWYRSLDVAGYITPTSDEFDEIDDQLSKFLEEAEMAICDDLTTTLDALSDSIELLATSQGGGCCGLNGAGAVPAQSSPFVDNGAAVPGGYGSVSEYQSYKCRIWLDYKEEWATSLQNVGLLSLAGLGVSAIAAALGSSLGVVTVAMSLTQLWIIAAAILVLAATAYGLSAATADAIAFLDQLDDCEVVEQTDVDSLILHLYDEIDNATFESSIDFQTKQMLKSFVTADGLNAMYQPKPILEPMSADVCGCSPILTGYMPTTENETAFYWNGSQWQFDCPAGITLSGEYYYDFYTVGVNCVDLTNVTLTGFTAIPSPVGSYHWTDCADVAQGWDVEPSTGFVESELESNSTHYFTIRSSTPYTIVADIAYG